jgi:hypothetical protein
VHPGYRSVTNPRYPGFLLLEALLVHVGQTADQDF